MNGHAYAGAVHHVKSVNRRRTVVAPFGVQKDLTPALRMIVAFSLAVQIYSVWECHVSHGFVYRSVKRKRDFERGVAMSLRFIY